MISLRKIDLLNAAIIGELCFLLLYFAIQNATATGFNDLPFGVSGLIAGAIIFPISTLLGMYVAKIGTRYVKSLVQVAKFALVGVLNTLIDIGAFTIIAGIIAPASTYVFSSVKILTFLLANINSYAWNKFWVFGTDKANTENKAGEMLSFLSVSVGGLAVNIIAFVLFSLMIESFISTSEIMSRTLAAVLASGTAFVWNFIGYKFLVFKK